MGEKTVLDVCCGARMFYSNKSDERVIFGDERRETHTLCDGRLLTIEPDVLFDFRDLPFGDKTFHTVVFDPPHLIRAGKKSWLALKYGKLNENWKDDLRAGFNECFRVLKPHGCLIFKWNETQVKLSEVLKLTNEKPLIANKQPKQSGTHWVIFLKGGE